MEVTLLLCMCLSQRTNYSLFLQDLFLMIYGFVPSKMYLDNAPWKERIKPLRKLWYEFKC